MPDRRALLAALILALPAGLLADDYPGGRPATPVSELPKLRKQLRTGDWNARIDAVHRLGEMGESAVPSLRKALKDRSPRVRASAAFALGNIGRPAENAVPALVRALRDKNADVRYSAAESLGRIGAPAARKAFERYLRREFRRSLRESRR